MESGEKGKSIGIFSSNPKLNHLVTMFGTRKKIPGNCAQLAKCAIIYLFIVCNLFIFHMAYIMEFK